MKILKEKFYYSGDDSVFCRYVWISLDNHLLICHKKKKNLNFVNAFIASQHFDILLTCKHRSCIQGWTFGLFSHFVVKV